MKARRSSRSPRDWIFLGSPKATAEHLALAQALRIR